MSGLFDSQVNIMVRQIQVVEQIAQFEILNFSQSNQYFWMLLQVVPIKCYEWHVCFMSKYNGRTNIGSQTNQTVEILNFSQSNQYFFMLLQVGPIKY